MLTQLSTALGMLSPSRSPSQMSPMPSPSVSSCERFEKPAQLSQTSPTPSPSPSAWSRFDANGQLSWPSLLPSPSASSVYARVLPSSVYATHTEQPQPQLQPPPTVAGAPQSLPRHSGLSGELCANAPVAVATPSAAIHIISF